MSAIAELHRVWTFEDLQSLPEDVDWRYFEILDGALVVSPSTDLRHEIVSEQVRNALSEAGRPEFTVYGPIAVDIDPSYLIPDLVVSRTASTTRNANPMPAAAILLCVEIVSPGSRSMDRIVKPAQYARAGIPSYWRVEVDPTVSITAYELRSGAYVETGTWGPGQTAEIDQPFAITIEIDSIRRPD